MSSIRRVISQGDPRVKFLRFYPSTGSYEYVTNANMDNFLGTTATQTIQSTNGINTIAISESSLPDLSNGSTNLVLRDMGRRVTVAYPSSTAATTGLHRAIYLQVQPISGADREGVPVAYSTTDSFWVPIWAADSDDTAGRSNPPVMRFVRTG